MTRIIPERESLTVEFKSDLNRLPDRELIAAVVCLANTEGGILYVGVEDDGQVTGLHHDHQNFAGVVALIANRTVPPVGVRAEVLTVEGLPVGKLTIPKARQHEIAQCQADLGLLDYSALPLLGATSADLDPLERERLRQCIQRYGGDTSLLALADEELDGALGLVRREAGRLVPTVTGLLILGREAALRAQLPTHEVAFQVLLGTDVRVNDFYRTPLLKTFERVEEQFHARVVEEEIEVDLFRVPIPNFDRRAFREALVNALVHRDYTRLGAIHVQWEAEGIVISNPGGFVEGVTLDNLLVVAPRPRNPLLADAIKRIGLAERTGRGIDLIYQGLLRCGRPAPNYGRSTAHTVVVVLPGGAADVGLLRTIIAEEKRLRQALPVDSLIALALLRQERRVDTARLGREIQRDEDAARNVLERLVEAGLVQAHGVGRGRTYTMSPNVYQQMGQAAAYVRQAGFDVLQQEHMVLQFAQTHGRIARKDAATLCRISEDQASRLLRKLKQEKKLTSQGSGRSVYYTLP